MVVVALLTFASVYVIAAHRDSPSVSSSPRPSPTSLASVPDVAGVPDVSIDVLPISGVNPWRINSISNRQLAQCLTHERIDFIGVNSREYVNNILGAHASVSWISGVIAPPDYLTSAIQLCAAGADRTSEAIGVNVGDFFDASATMAASGRVRSYATAARADQWGTTGIPAVMILAFWTQPGAPMMSPSPASVVAARGVALYKLAALGIANPAVVSCRVIRERPGAKVPSEVEALIKARYAKLAPITILSKYTAQVDLRAESVTPHICVYSDGRQVAYTGKVPTLATQAIELDVHHAPWPPTENVENFVMLAKIPTKGWVVINEGTAP